MIRLCEPSFDDADRRRIESVLSSGMLVQGDRVAELEATLAAFLGVDVVACHSGTAALHLALQAVGVVVGDEVVVPAFTWPSAASAVVQVGARPVFVDIDPETLNLDPRALEAAVGSRTRALLPIHQFGIPAPMGAVMALAEERGLRVIEDAACAIGTVCEGGELAGTIGDVGCFSFHPRKVITTGEGGAVATRDTDTLERLRTLRNHGQDVTAGLERFVTPGLNQRMPELSAALGIGQAQRLGALLARRRALAAEYLRLLEGVTQVRVPSGLRAPGNNFQSFVVDAGSLARRERLMQHCANADIQTTIGTYAVTAQPAFIALGADPARTPHAVAAMERLVTLPLHPAMTEGDVARVVEVIGNCELED